MEQHIHQHAAHEACHQRQPRQEAVKARIQGLPRRREMGAPGAVIEFDGQGVIEYIPFPNDLAGKYQCFTEANNSRLLTEGGYKNGFLTLTQGVENYILQLNHMTC